MICLPQFGITNPMIPTSPLRSLKLLTRPTPSRVSFNHFLWSTNLLLSQDFPKTHHMLGSSREMRSHLPPWVTNTSWVLDTTQSAQDLGLVLITQISPPNSIILHLRLGSHKERLGRAQETAERLFKWSWTTNPREGGGGGVPFIRI
jgi:hypothetical protein